MIKGLLKALAMIVMIAAMMFSLTACGSRLEGTYKSVELGGSYIRFSDGKVYSSSDGDFNGAQGWPYKIKNGRIQVSTIGVQEYDFSLKGDNLTYGTKKYVNVKSKTIDNTINDVAKSLESFDGTYINVYSAGESIVTINSKDKIMTIETGAKLNEIELFYVKVDGDVISGENFQFKKSGDSLLGQDGWHKGKEYVREGGRSIFYGVYAYSYEEEETTSRNEKRSVPYTFYYAIDENGLGYRWSIRDGESYQEVSQFIVGDITDEYNCKFSHGNVQFSNSKETFTSPPLRSSYNTRNDEWVFTRVEGVSIPN